MEAGVQELLRDFFLAADIGAGDTDIDLALQGLVDDVRSDSAVCRRDLRRLLEKDPAGFLQSACRMIKVSPEKTGSEPLLDLLWSSSLLVSSLIDPSLLSLPTATALANRWVAFDPMLDIKLLRIGFPMAEDNSFAVIDKARPKRAMDIVCGLPPNRHVLLSLGRLLRYPDVHVRSKSGSDLCAGEPESGLGAQDARRAGCQGPRQCRRRLMGDQVCPRCCAVPGSRAGRGSSRGRQRADRHA